MKGAVRKAAGLFMLAALFAACDSTSTTDGGNNNDPTLALAVGVTTATLEQGGTASIPVTITRGGSFTGAVTVTATGLPTGVTANTATIASGSTTGTITLTATSTAAPATATVTVHANGTGVTEQTKTVALTTTVKGTYTLAGSPNTVSLAAGTSAQTAVAITRANGFAGDVALTTNAPAGITATLASNSFTGAATSSALTIAAASSVAPGTYTVTVQGATPGLANQTVSFTITVTPAAGFTVAAPTTLTVAQGASSNGTVAITRTGSFTGAVNLTATAPAGLTVTFNPAAATGTTSGVTVTASSTIAPGPYTVSVKGDATGLTQQTSNIAVTVTAAPTPSITLAVAPSPIAVTGGANATAQLTVTRNGGFTGAVTLTADAAPAGITFGLNPTTIAAGSTTAAVSVAAAVTAAAGTFNVTVHATGAGIAEQTLTVPITVTAAPGTLGVTALPTSLSIAAGGSGTSTLTVTRGGSFTGAVNFTADAPPAGITVSFNPTSAAAGVTTSVATVNVASSVAPGTYNVVVRANGTGVTEQVVTIPVTVTTAGSFTLGVAPASLTIAQGANANTTLTITRVGGFAPAVNLTATAPAGVTVTFTPSSVTGTTSTVNVAVAGSVAAGAQNVTIRANAAGVAEQTISLPVTVTGGVVSGGNVSFLFCGTTGTPIYAAAKNGNGNWTPVQAQQNGSYAFQIDGTGGFAWVTPITTGGFRTDVYYGSAADLNIAGAQSCRTQSGAGKTVMANIANLGATDALTIFLGKSPAVVSGNALTFTNVDNGNVDLIGGRLAFDLSTFSIMPVKFYLQKNLNPGAGTTLPTIDANSGFTPTAATATIVNLNGDNGILSSALSTANGSFGSYWLELGVPTTATTRTWYGYPAGTLGAGDTYFTMITAIGADTTSSRLAAKVQSSLQNLTLTLGPNLTPPTVSVLGSTGYVKLRAAYPIQAAYPDFFTATFNQNPSGGATARQVVINAFASFTGATTATLDVPDLTGVGSWDNNWGIKTGSQVTWTFSATDLTSLLAQPYTDGQVFTFASKNGTITP